MGACKRPSDDETKNPIGGALQIIGALVENGADWKTFGETLKTELANGTLFIVGMKVR